MSLVLENLGCQNVAFYEAGVTEKDVPVCHEAANLPVPTPEVVADSDWEADGAEMTLVTLCASSVEAEEKPLFFEVTEKRTVVLFQMKVAFCAAAVVTLKAALVWVVMETVSLSVGEEETVTDYLCLVRVMVKACACAEVEAVMVRARVCVCAVVTGMAYLTACACHLVEAAKVREMVMEKVSYAEVVATLTFFSDVAMASCVSGAVTARVNIASCAVGAMVKVKVVFCGAVRALEMTSCAWVEETGMGTLSCVWEVMVCGVVT